MKVIDINPLRDTSILLGKQGENLVRTIRFDVSEFVSEFGDGAAQLLMLRPREKLPYNCTITQEDNLYSWEVDSTATANAGIGLVELRWMVDDTLAKSGLFRARIIPALMNNVAEPPATFWAQLDAAIAQAGETQASLESVLEDLDLDTLNQTVATATETESALETLISAATTTKGELDNSTTAAVVAQSDLEDATTAASAAQAELETVTGAAAEATTAAETAKTNLETATSTANTAKSNLTTATTTANTAKANLDKSTTAATTAQSNLEDATTAAGTAQAELETATDAAAEATTAANTAKANLDTATAAANTAKTELDSSTDAANTAKSELDDLVNAVRVASRAEKQASFSVASGSSDTSETMTVDMSTLSEASIDVYAVVGSGVTLTVGGQGVMQSSVWGDVLSETDVIHVTARLECRDGLWLIGIAAPVDADTTVQPVVTSGYLSDSTDNDISVSVVLTSASGALSAGCEGEIWGR